MANKMKAFQRNPGTTTDRPGLQRMLFEAKHKRPSYLILWKLDRLSREVQDSFIIDAQLREVGVQIVTVAELLPEDEGLRYAIQGLYASMTHNFIVNHRSNVMRGLNYNAENALYNGRKLAKNQRGGKGAARKLKPEEVDFWLTGHIHCSECGAPLHGISGTSKTGNVYYYYTCLKHKKKVCKMGNQPKEKIETIVRHTLDRMLEDSTLRLFIAKMCFDYYEDSKGDDKGAYLQSLKNKLKSVEGELKNFAKAIGAGIFNETTQQAMSELENQKHLLKDQIEAEELGHHIPFH